jgi:putative membrane-bound dehydrogenase-like protein
MLAMKTLLALLVLSAVTLHAATQITWTRQQLHADFYSEGAAIGDINGDSKPDIVAGPFWWEGPAFEKKHAYYEPKIFNINGYSDNFFAYIHDFNADQKNDILILGFPGKEARLYLNPGKAPVTAPRDAPKVPVTAPRDEPPTYWPTHIVADVVDNESPTFTDITGDGKPELICSTTGRFGWFAPNWANPTEKWPFIPVTPDLKVAKFTHGLGVGDVNNDGHPDLLEARHWWQAPTENSEPRTENWQQHTFATGIPGGAQMFAYDFDGNGTNDIFTSLSAHRYGVAVYLQNKTENREQRTANWTQRMLASEQPQDNDYGIVFSQPHAAHLADIDGDGIQDIVTGKRYWAHNGHDPDEHGHRVLYWYQTKRDGKGGVDFIPHLIDANTGVGTDVQVGDVNGDHLPDVLVANKSGVFILTQQRLEISDLKSQISDSKMYGPALKPQAKYAKGQSPQDALKNIQLPTGFKAELIAAEPDLVQPIAFTFDERGRIWVIEGNSYPKPREIGQGQDRIKILEDTNGDGTFETKKIFCEGLNLASGIELGFGGIYVGAAPYLMFIPRDGDKPLPPGSNRAIPGPIESNAPKPSPLTQVPGLPFTAHILLDGWGTQDTHETLNSFIWGPDGWLYGCHGVFTHSRIGKPGTPDAKRQPLNAGIWRYHPVRHEFEVFAHGTSNPWGLDYDQHGEWFVTACVIPHLYHIVPGGRYQRQAGQHFNPHTYEDIKTIADHAHYAGNPRPDVAKDLITGAGIVNDDTNALGGGHAHCGLAIYQSSLFPPTYRNQLLFGNLHGHRLVANYTDPKGSTYIGKHAADFMRANDMHFIPVTQKVGPDGALYVSDWSDQQICHRGSNAIENWDRTNGRLYRITYGSADTPVRHQNPNGEAALTFPKAPFNLSNESPETLTQLALQTENNWFSRTARRLLMEHAATGTLPGASGPNYPDWLKLMLESQGAPKPQTALRALWLETSLSSLGGGGDFRHFFQSQHPEILTAIIRYLSNAIPQSIRRSTETPPRMDGYFEGWYPRPLVTLAKESHSPIVRREIASMLSALPQTLDLKHDLATALLSHPEDKDDPMIPLLIWYGIEPLVAADPSAALQLAKASKMPKVTGFIYRRLSSDDAGRTSLLKLAAETPDPVLKLDLLNALVQAARNGHQITKPDGWDALRQKVVQSFSSSGAVKPNDANHGPKPMTTLLELEASMGIETALQHFRDQLASANGNREHALTVLLQAKDTKTAQTLLQLIQTNTPTSLRRKAIQALASLKDTETPRILSAALPKLSANELPDAINTLASTQEGAKALLQAVAKKSLPTNALSPFLIRQLTAFDDPDINTLIKSAWGDVNAPKADLAERTQKYRALLTPAALAKGDLAKGKLLYTATCGQCHQLFGEGQNVGPDITGSNRADLNYLLENVLDPNAVIGKAYQLNLFTMKDGRVMSGVIKDENPAAIKIAMMGGVEFTLPQADIAKREVSKLSTMPEGLFDALQPAQVIDLVKYLQSNGTTPNTPRPGLIEGESLLPTAKTTGGSVKSQAMGGFKAGAWTGNSHLWWTGGKPGSKLSLTFNAPKAGRQKIFATFTKAPDYGIITARLNGTSTSIENYDLYDPKVIPTTEQHLGDFDLKPGPNTLELEITGSNPNARPSHMVALDYLRLTPP